MYVVGDATTTAAGRQLRAQVVNGISHEQWRAMPRMQAGYRTELDTAYGRHWDPDWDGESGGTPAP